MANQIPEAKIPYQNPKSCFIQYTEFFKRKRQTFNNSELQVSRHQNTVLQIAIWCCPSPMLTLGLKMFACVPFVAQNFLHCVIRQILWRGYFQ